MPAWPLVGLSRVLFPARVTVKLIPVSQSTAMFAPSESRTGAEADSMRSLVTTPLDAAALTFASVAFEYVATAVSPRVVL